MPVDGSRPRDRRPTLEEQFALMKAPLEEFRRLLRMSYEEVIAAVRRAAQGEATGFALLQAAEPAIPALRDRATDPAPPATLAAQRLLTGQAMQFYLMRAVHGMSPDQFEEHVEVIGIERLEEAREGGRGAFLLNSHFGPGRLAPIILARLGWKTITLSPFDYNAILDIPLGDRATTIELVRTFGLKVLAMSRDALLAGKTVHSTGDGLRTAKDSVHAFLGAHRPFTDSYAVVALATGVDCLPVFLRSDGDGRVSMEICEPLDKGDEAAPPAERASGMVRQYVHALEQRWLSDFGNVPLRSLRLYGNRWQRKTLRQEGDRS